MRVLTGGTSTKSGLSRGHYVSRARKTGLQLYTQGVATCDIMYLGPDEMTLGTDVMELCPPSGLTTVCEPMTLTDDVMTLGGDPMTLCTTGIRECGHIVLGSGNPLVLTSEATDGVLTFCGIAPSYEAVDPSTRTYYGDACIIDGEATIVNDNRAVLYVWYDNEFGYACQVIRVVQKWAGISYPLIPQDVAELGF